VKDVEQVAAIDMERFYSDPPADSKLVKPSVRPALPPIPTATFMAKQASEEQEAKLAARRKKNLELFKAFAAKNTPSSSQPS